MWWGKGFAVSQFEIGRILRNIFRTLTAAYQAISLSLYKYLVIKLTYAFLGIVPSQKSMSQLKLSSPYIDH